MTTETPSTQKAKKPLLTDWRLIEELMSLIVTRHSFTSNKGRTERCKENGKSYSRKHLLLARMILTDLKRQWKVEGLKGIMTFTEYYQKRKGVKYGS